MVIDRAANQAMVGGLKAGQLDSFRGRVLQPALSRLGVGLVCYDPRLYLGPPLPQDE